MVPVFAYSFRAKQTRGRMRVEAPAGWSVEAPDLLELPAHERSDLPLVVTVPDRVEGGPGVIRVRGEFGPAGQAVLSLRLLPQP